MSSTNKTEHLQLNQWVGTDPFRMADFNEDNAKIDAAVKANADAIATVQSGTLKIATGTYKGTGTCGQANPTSLTFSFTPKLVWIQNTDGSYRALFIRGANAGAGSCYTSPYTFLLNCTWSSNSLTWYDPAINAAASAWNQLNYKSRDYFWFALY